MAPERYSLISITPEEYTGQSRGFEAVYFYRVYKMERGIRAAADMGIAAGCPGSEANNGVATFNEFIRYIIPQDVSYNPSAEDVRENRLDTIHPDERWIGNNLCRVAAGYSGPDPERLHRQTKAWKRAGELTAIIDADILDAVRRTLEMCCTCTYLDGRLVYPVEHEDRYWCCIALKLARQTRLDAEFACLRRHLEPSEDSRGRRGYFLEVDARGTERGALADGSGGRLELYGPEASRDEMPAAQWEFWRQKAATGGPDRGDVLMEVTGQMKYARDVASGEHVD